MGKLEVKELNKKYSGGAQAITEFNLSTEGIVAVLGKEKAGKTSLLKCLAGLEDYTGEVLINGRNISQIKKEERNIFMFFDDLALFDKKDVYFNLAYSLVLREEEQSVIDDRIRESIEIFDIRPLLFKKVKELDDVEKRKVALARILLRKADLYLLDDPLQGLDGDQRKSLFTKLKKVIKRLNAPVVYATSDVGEALEISDTIKVLHLGFTKQTGCMEDLYYNPQNMYTASLLGKMNFIMGDLSLTNDDYLSAECTGYRFLLNDTIKKRLLSEDYIGREVIFGFRPDAVIFGESGIKVDILDCVAKAGYYEVYIALNDYEIVANSPKKVQNTAKISLNSSKFCIFDVNAEASILKE